MSIRTGTSRDGLEGVETSPDGRYIRFDEKLGTGAYKSVWLAYDTDHGIEVAWNTVDLKRLPEREKSRLKSETDILKNLNHQCIINFYNSWENPELDQVVFTTEIVTSGTLKQYINRFKPIKLKVIKRWCRQILLGLCYLHSKDPPIIHRDLKCDNIFINGSTGDIRIGDLGLSTMRNETHVASVLGTPEFMAPELYDEWYTEKVDVYAFGMCVLEMVSNEYPYSECTNTAQIFKKVSAGVYPDALQRVQHQQTKEFIELCLIDSHVRLAAKDLLHHPFLENPAVDPRDRFAVQFTPLSSAAAAASDQIAAEVQTAKVPEEQPPVLVDEEADENSHVSSLEVLLESTSDNIARIVLRLDLGNRRKEIKFPFDLDSDTAEAVAAEMVKELRLQDQARVQLADGIFNSIRDERQKWKLAVRQQRDLQEAEASVDTMPLLPRPSAPVSQAAVPAAAAAAAPKAAAKATVAAAAAAAPKAAAKATVAAAVGTPAAKAAPAPHISSSSSKGASQSAVAELAAQPLSSRPPRAAQRAGEPRRQPQHVPPSATEAGVLPRVSSFETAESAADTDNLASLSSLDSQARAELRAETEVLPVPVIKQKIAYVSESPDVLKRLVGTSKSELIDVFIDLAMSARASSVPSSTSVSATVSARSSPGSSSPARSAGHMRRRSELPSDQIPDALGTSRLSAQKPVQSARVDESPAEIKELAPPSGAAAAMAKDRSAQGPPAVFPKPHGASKSPDAIVDVNSFLNGLDISVLSSEQLTTLRKSRTDLDESIRLLKQQYANMYRESVNKYKADVLDSLAAWGINVPAAAHPSSRRPVKSALSKRTRDVISKAKTDGTVDSSTSAPTSNDSSTSAPTNQSGAQSAPETGPVIDRLTLHKSRSTSKLRSTPETESDAADDIYNRLIQPFAQRSRAPAGQSRMPSDESPTS